MAEGVRQHKDLTLVFEAPSGGTFKVYTDMPGGVMVLGRTLTLPTTTTRKEMTWPLDNPSLLEGKLIKYRCETSGIVRLFSGSIRFRKVGTYIDGTQGEVWESQELSF